MSDFPMESFARFYENHGLLSVKEHPQWYFIKGGSQSYIKAFLNQFPGIVNTRSPVKSVSRHDSGVRIHLSDGSRTDVDGVVIATHADEALALLENPTDMENDLLSPWRYSTNAVVLHTDSRFLPPNIKARASWNAIRESGHTHDAPVSLTYDMTRLQHLDTETTYCVTLNPATPISENHIIETMTYTHPIFDFPAIETQSRLERLNDQGNTWFCGSYFGYGFHEDAVRSAVNVGKLFGARL
jgi:predicted NAD/FAD-binding protein